VKKRDASDQQIGGPKCLTHISAVLPEVLREIAKAYELQPDPAASERGR
jgi:hypothetical protein